MSLSLVHLPKDNGFLMMTFRCAAVPTPLSCIRQHSRGPVVSPPRLYHHIMTMITPSDLLRMVNSKPPVPSVLPRGCKLPLPTSVVHALTLMWQDLVEWLYIDP
jgi:hypothetical protein